MVTFFSFHLGAPPLKTIGMEKVTLSFAAVAAIIAMAIPQACVRTRGTAGTQCAKPTLTPSDATNAITFVTVRIATVTPGAYLRYTLDGSTPTGGSSGNGTEIAAARGGSHGRVRGRTERNDVKSDCVQSGIGRFADRSRKLRLPVAVLRPIESRSYDPRL